MAPMVAPLKVQTVFLVTGNIHKFSEARRILNEHEIAVAMLRLADIVEIQDDFIENVAEARVLDAVQRCDLPVVVEDAGLFIERLGGFPGPYSSYAYRTIGLDGILKLMKGDANREACFKSVVEFMSLEMRDPRCFSGLVEGEIVEGRRGNQGFGFDPIFIPLGHSKTFAEMSIDEKNQCSHRASAFHRFGRWFRASSTAQKF